MVSLYNNTHIQLSIFFIGRPFEACEVIKQCVGKEDQDYCPAGLYFDKRTQQCETGKLILSN